MNYRLFITVLVITLINSKISFGQEKLGLKFIPMEVIDMVTISTANFSNPTIKTISKEAFLIDTYKNIKGLFLVKKVNNNWLVLSIEFENSYDNIKVIGDFITYTYHNAGAAQGVTYFYSYFGIINLISHSSLILMDESHYESWTIPGDQLPNESDAAYKKRSEKESNKREESCSTTIDFDGHYLHVKRKDKKACNDYIASGRYQFVKDRFVRRK